MASVAAGAPQAPARFTASVASLSAVSQADLPPPPPALPPRPTAPPGASAGKNSDASSEATQDLRGGRADATPSRTEIASNSAPQEQSLLLVPIASPTVQGAVVYQAMPVPAVYAPQQGTYIPSYQLRPLQQQAAPQQPREPSQAMRNASEYMQRAQLLCELLGAATPPSPLELQLIEEQRRFLWRNWPPLCHYLLHASDVAERAHHDAALLSRLTAEAAYQSRYAHSPVVQVRFTEKPALPVHGHQHTCVAPTRKGAISTSCHACVGITECRDAWGVH